MNAVVEIRQNQAQALVMSEGELIKVLQTSLYPGAALESIKMVIGYCKAAGLDPMQKPVHIVPMWDGKTKQLRDVIMPGVGLYRTQASRTGQFAGMSEPDFGQDVTKKLGGVEVTYPEYARVTVKRALPNGVVAEFTAIEYWLENYAVKGGQEKSIAPNAMWTKRPKGQIAKCAAAQALRIAFPELGAAPTADEMEGKTVNAEIDVTPQQPKEAPAELLQAASNAAKNGIAAYSAFWSGESNDNRAILVATGDHAKLKKAAADADARIVDTDFIADMDKVEAV